MGHLSDPCAVRIVFSAADVFAVPSRLEVLSLVGVEALACGTPVVGFDIGGLPSRVPNNDMGTLARPFDGSDLAAALKSVLDRQTTFKEYPSPMSKAARACGEDLFGPGGGRAI